MNNFQSKEMLAYRQYAGTIDIPKVADIIDNPLHDGQKEIASWFMGKKREEWQYMSILNSRRWGKTRMLTVIGCAELLTPFSNVGIVGTSISVAKEFFNFINRYLKHLQQQGHIKEFRASISELHIHIPETGSNLYIASETTYEDRIVGKALSLLIYDEAFLIEDRFFTESLHVLQPAGANYGIYDTGLLVMKVVCASTPRNRPTATTAGKRHLKGMYHNDEGYKSFKYDAYTSPFMTEAMIEAYRKSMPTDQFEREFLCKFAVDSTGVFPRFSQEKNVIKIDLSEIKERPHDFFLVTSADWGSTDASASVTGIYDSRKDKAYILREFFASNTLNEDFIKQMKKTEEELKKSLDIPDGNILRFSDPAEKQGRMQAANLDFPMQRAVNARMEGYDTVNAWFEGKFVESLGEREPDLYIDESCQKTIQQVMAAEYKESQGVKTNVLKRDTEHLHYDLAETLRYWVASMKRFTKKSEPILV